MIKQCFNILLFFFLSYSIGNAQSIKRSVISSFGASSSTTNIILESTLGQPSNIGTVSDGNNYIRQGFQQPINQLSTPCVVSVLDSQNVTCFGGNDGYIQVGGTGGTSLFHYTLQIYNSTFGFWQQIGQSPLGNGFTYAPVTFSSLYADCYKIIMDDSLGCVDTIDVCLTEPAEIITNNNVSSCDSYDWDGFTYYNSGIYTNVYTNTDGCDSTVNLDLTITSCPGCTDSLANNYNPFATIDDGTCLYSPFIFGCTDSTALNYDPLATVDDSSCCYSSGQLWSQIGQDIDGEAVDDFNGWSVSSNGSGNIVAVGAHGNDTNGSRSGKVKIFENIAGIWTQIGQSIDGMSGNDYNGWSVSLSEDGNVIAIGAPNRNYSSDTGYVRVFAFDGSAWNQLGNNISAIGGGDQFGYSVSLSKTGNVVAVGAPYNDGNSGYIHDNRGSVQIFSFDGITWTQTGQDIFGDFSGDNMGHSVSLNYDGTIVAVAATENSNNSNNAAGVVKIFSQVSSNWSQVGTDLFGENSNDRFGKSLSLNYSGDRLIVSSHGDNAWSDSGYVKIYENYLGTFNQLGQRIHGNM